jgi:hypothetical protein
LPSLWTLFSSREAELESLRLFWSPPCCVLRGSRWRMGGLRSRSLGSSICSDRCPHDARTARGEVGVQVTVSEVECALLRCAWISEVRHTLHAWKHDVTNKKFLSRVAAYATAEAIHIRPCPLLSTLVVDPCTSHMRCSR